MGWQWFNLYDKIKDKMTLPKQVTIQESVFNDTDIEAIADVVSDYLSDTYGFCHKGFELEIKAKNIKWDTSN